MQTGAVGYFIYLVEASKLCETMPAARSGCVYVGAFINNGAIYMQTFGVGDFNVVDATFDYCEGLAADPSGNVYACNNQRLYVQTGGVGSFNMIGQDFANSGAGMAAAPNGNVYACMYNGDIYMQTGGGFNLFFALDQTHRAWTSMAAAPNGNVYACVYNGDIYMQTN